MWKLLRTWLGFLLVAGFLLLFLWLFEVRQRQPRLTSEQTQSETVKNASDPLPTSSTPPAASGQPLLDQTPPNPTLPTAGETADLAAASSAEPLIQGGQIPASRPPTAASDSAASPVALPAQSGRTQAEEANRPSSPSAPNHASSLFPALRTCPIFSQLDPHSQLMLEPFSQTLQIQLPVGADRQVFALFGATLVAIQPRNGAYDLYLVDGANRLCLFLGGLSELQPGLGLQSTLACGAPLGQLAVDSSGSRLQIRLSRFGSEPWWQGQNLDLMAFLGIQKTDSMP